MNLSYRKSDILRGALIYSSGDTIAAVILSEFSIYRLIGIIIIGATFYAFEIPNYFSWIDRKLGNEKGNAKSLKRTILALLYFNPLWIARHLFFINVFKGNFVSLNLSLVVIGFYSFMLNIPISFIMNYLIQNKVKLKWRFTASAIFSALMAIYYALSEVLFR
jgi:hypothetical protein